MYLYKVNLKILWHVAQGTLFGTLSHNFLCILILWKRKKWKIIRLNIIQTYEKMKTIVFHEFNISFALIFRKWNIVLSKLTLGIPN